MTNANISEFEESIGISFIDKNLIKKAFTHRSYLNENKSLKLGHNERLEFLGDAVLELVVTDFLYKKFPQKNEGELTALRSALVKAETLAAAAELAGMNAYLLLSKGESKDTGRARQYILANTFESVVGAIYLDQGYDIVAKFIADQLFAQIDDIIENKTFIDSKSRFQEMAQEKTGFTPSYKLIKEVGPDHNKIFTVAVTVGEETITEGEGKSKQEAEQMAAEKALEIKAW
ncbi:MAG: ribonuclease III [bacterium]